MKLDRRLWQLARSVRFQLSLTITLGLILGVLIIAQARALADIINQVFLQAAPLGQVWTALIGLLLIMIARALVSYGSEASAYRAAARLKTQLRERLLDHLIALGPAYVQRERTGELINTTLEGVETLEAYFSQYLPQLIMAALLPVTILIFVFQIDLLSGVVLLLTGPLIPFFMILIGRAADALTRRQWKSLGWMSAHFLDMLQGLTTLKIFGRSRQQIETIAQVSNRYRDATLSVLRVAFLSAFALEMIATISTAMVAVEIGLRLLAGQLQFEQALFVLVLAPDFYLPLRVLGTRFHAGLSGVAAAQRIFEILEAPTLPDGSTAIPEAWSTLSFNDVQYSYAAGQRPALKGASFSIERGQQVALVGPTGSGKSTIVNLLLGFIRPQSGTIEIDGIRLADLDPYNWRAQIAYISQQPYLFHESVLANIRLGKPDATLADVIHAAQLAHADEFVRALPNGYETLIGERGVRLSGGQAQRVALARAFLKNAPVLILDEATSSLDAENEALIQESIDQLMHGRTVVSISHHGQTGQHFDRVIALSHGQVVETTDHQPATPAAAQPAGDQVTPSNEVTSPLGAGSPAPALSPPPSALSTCWRLLKLAAPFKGWMAIAALLGSLTIGSSIGLMAASAFIIASAALHPSIADLAVAIVGVRFFGIARGVFRYLERLVSHRVNLSLLAQLRVWFYRSIEPLAPARLLSYRSGDLLSRVVGDIETLQNFFVRVIAPPAVALIIALCMTLYLSNFSPGLAFIVLLLMVIIGLLLPILVQRMSRQPGRALVTLRAQLNQQLMDGLQGLTDLIAFGREREHADRIKTSSRELIRVQSRMAAITALHTALSTLLANVAMWLVLVAAIPLVAAHAINGVYLPVLALATLASFEGVLALPLAFQYLGSNLQAAQRLFELVDASAVGVIGQPIKPVDLDRQQPIEISIRNLSFRYSPNEPLVLDQFSCDLTAGRSVVLVGSSGAGKSTLVNVLLRFWDFDQGQILLNGHDVRDYNPEQVRQLISVVPQRTHLFNASIRDNLLIARSSASEAEIIQAARQAELHEFIQSLPEQYDTVIGEQGLQLSGGERQRLAIARAFLKDAPLLILDEATANLDPLTERAVLRALQARQANRAILMITHRVPGLESADEIIVLNHGC